jgi:hypothetical protein
MKKKKVSQFRMVVRLAVAVALLSGLLTLGSLSPQAAVFKMSYVELAGANGGQNNVAFAFERYVLIAPYAAKDPVEDNGDLSQLDNHFLYVIDTKKPGITLSKDLTVSVGAGNTRTIYYPTKLTFDPVTQYVFVRGTRFEQIDGGVEAIEVLAYLHLNLGENGKPIFDSSVTSFDIPGVGGEPNTADAPTDLALAAKGDQLVFTNGASIFTYRIDQGYLYKVDLVHPSEYGPDNFISYLALDHETGVLSVYSTKKSNGPEASPVARDQSEISFYKLVDDGTLTLLKRAYAEDLPAASSLIPGSNIEVFQDGDKQSALFVTSDGSVCQVDLLTDGLSASVRQIANFDELAQDGSDDTAARFVKYDVAKRVLGLIRQGYSAQISRPGNGRRGRISRPGNVHVLTSQPVLAMAKLNKKGKVTSRNVFTDDFVDQGGLSQLLATSDSSNWLMATYSGKLLSITTSGNFEDARPQLIDNVAPRIERLDYLTSRESVVAVQSCSTDADAQQPRQPGSVAVGKLVSANGKTFLSTAAPMVLSSTSQLLRHAPSIRRPGNVRR